MFTRSFIISTVLSQPTITTCIAMTSAIWYTSRLGWLPASDSFPLCSRKNKKSVACNSAPTCSCVLLQNSSSLFASIHTKPTLLTSFLLPLAFQPHGGGGCFFGPVRKWCVGYVWSSLLAARMGWSVFSLPSWHIDQQTPIFELWHLFETTYCMTFLTQVHSTMLAM